MLSRMTLLGLVLCLLAGGCASISKEECANANWEALGYRDGGHGKPASRFGTHQKACAKHGYQADFTRYMEGHRRGLEDVYCKPRNGYHLGLRGAGYNNVCPSDLEQPFLSAYNSGRDIFKMERSYRLLNQKAVNMNHQIGTLDARIDQLRQAVKRDALADHPKTAHELRNARTETVALYNRIRAIRRRAQQEKVFKDHLWRAVAAQKERSERCITNNVRQPNITRSQRQAIRNIAGLSLEKGHIKSRINWINSDPGSVRPSHKNRYIRSALQQELKDIMQEISTLKSELKRHRFTTQVKKHLAHCFQQAEHVGVLQHHQEALSHLRRVWGLKTLMNIHFDAEIDNLNQRIDFARNHLPSKKARTARQERKRELHDARRQRNDYRHELKNVELKLGGLRQEIDQLKSQSRY